MRIGLDLKFLGLVVVVIGLGGCAPSSDSKDDNKYPFPTYDSSNPIYRELKAASLSCYSSECESNKQDFESIGLVGMVVENKPRDWDAKLGQCTGFLFGSQDIVALNSHCISDSMWANKSNCGEYLGIKFPAVPGKEAEIRMCEEIIFRSDLKEDFANMIKQDYAFFRIKSIDRKPLPMASAPVKNNEAISVRKVNPPSSYKKLEGYLDYARCESQMNSLLSLKDMSDFLSSGYHSEWSKVGLGVRKAGSYQSCKIIQGNSGSPVLNSRSEIIGFAQSYATSAFLKLLKTDELKQALKKVYGVEVNLNLPNELNEHFHFTQVHCAKNPQQISANNDLCDVKLGELKEEEFFKEVKGSEEEMLSKFKGNYLQTYKPFFMIDIKKTSAEGSDEGYVVTPTCVLPPNKWDKKYVSVEKSSVVKSSNLVKTQSLPLFVKFAVDISYDQNLLVTAKNLKATNTSGYFKAEILNKQISLRKSYQVGSYYPYEKTEEIPNVNWCP